MIGLNVRDRFRLTFLALTDEEIEMLTCALDRQARHISGLRRRLYPDDRKAADLATISALRAKLIEAENA